jgi:hypothetical protein
MGDPVDCPKHAKQEKKIILSMLREMWLNGDNQSLIEGTIEMQNCFKECFSFVSLN